MENCNWVRSLPALLIRLSTWNKAEGRNPKRNEFGQNAFSLQIPSTHMCDLISQKIANLLLEKRIGIRLLINSQIFIGA